MDLTAWLLRHTPPRPLVVTTPGGTGARTAVERVLRERGWRAAMSPAEANILLVAGPVARELQPYAEALWRLVPAPRARANVDSTVDVATELDAAAEVLRDADQQRRQAAHSTDHEHETAEHGQDGHGDGGQSQHEHGHHERGESEQHGHEHGGQHGHDMGGMQMPGDVPMADRAEDRDGLTLDQLQVPLGPLLPDWPAGLVVRTTLQGDVIQEATVETVGLGDVHRTGFWRTPGRLTARRLDSCARLLSVAGWADASTGARRLRDTVLGGERTAETGRALAVWARRVRGSRTLRWLLAGAGATSDAPSTPPELYGDALARLHRWIDSILQTFDQPGSEEPHVDEGGQARWTLEVLPDLLDGTELATARLLVASLDPDLEALAHHEVAHG